MPHYTPTAKEKAIISSNTRSFINNYITLAPWKARTVEDFGHIGHKQGYNAYIVGSDQVWRPSYNPLQLAMFLSFTGDDNVKRLAYAASFGTSEWMFSSSMTEKCLRLARKFDMITVRENSGIFLCKKYLGVEAMQVLDPTMLLNKEDYLKLVVEENEPQSEGSLFYYFLDPSEEKTRVLDFVSRCNNIVPFTVMPKCQAENRTKSDIKHRISDCIFPSVASWLRGFNDARIVIVDSFHGAVFSIIFNKPFWVISNPKRGNARFESLLKEFGLEDRLLSSERISDDFDWNKPVNWDTVNEKREQERHRCIQLLNNVLIK